jgi:quinol-cytochrome oxidoreductase complex cytochrome b subunit
VRTVALLSMMYSPSIAARSSTIPFTYNPPILLVIDYMLLTAKKSPVKIYVLHKQN